MVKAQTAKAQESNNQRKANTQQAQGGQKVQKQQAKLKNYKADWWDEELLNQVKYPTVVLYDGERMKVKVLGVQGWWLCRDSSLQVEGAANAAMSCRS